MTTPLLIIVPARGGSKRVPDKNILPLAGESLLARTASVIKAAALGAPVLLTTDDKKIAEEGRRVGFDVPFLRPDELATDNSATEPAIEHAIDWWSKNHGRTPEMIMLLQPTSPFRSSDLLQKGLSILQEDPETEAVISVKRLHVSGNRIFTENAGYMSPIVNEQCGACFVPTGALYVIRSAVLRYYGSFFPPRTRHIIHDGISTLDIDTPEDWRLAEILATSIF